MRSLLTGFLVLIIAASGAFAWLQSRQRADLARRLNDQQAAWNKDKAALEAALKQSGRPASIIQETFVNVPTNSMAGALSAEQIMERLKTMRASTRDKSIRKVVHHLEMLADIGPDAIPTIKAYLDQYQDVEYSSIRQEESSRGRSEENREVTPASPSATSTEQRGRDRGRGERGREGHERERESRERDPRERIRSMFNRGDVRLTFSTPPSLRIGLFDVLAQIGGPAAEEVLSTVLSETGRSVEVAYLAKTLQEITPNKYRDMALTSAKDLLMNPMQAAPGDRLEENGKDYLYYVLNMYGDGSFAPIAQGLLVGNDGRIDMRALNYLSSTLKEQAMPSIYAAYNDPRLTNQWEKAPLLQMALNYVGPNSQANEMLNSVISNEELPGELRAMSVMALLRGEPSKETIEARLPVIEALKGSTADQRVQRSLQATEANLQKMLAGQPIDENPWRSIFRGSDRGGGENRSGTTAGQRGGESRRNRTPGGNQ